ncbi:ApeA N-terminal domain 1-containing protein [Clostridium butyricum]|uniref:ApeA N-terminal domain-containing protein n=1 Tax=Clostridium butyricum TaxID=1492 RepID=A0AAP9UDG0_CLOBU|nr:HEPN domain-containing protein [Clostridium butyricum]MBZ5746260.1 hypothetical protein [Clostridium butyricum]MDI9210074.1 hypothetical protein [Clostridium butyricum]QMW90147.1 hypothetical protein FF104_04035 [Clostridium butyricum]BBK77770.1 hypothetical protein Cbu04g_27780 [Clostridium butyricum]GEQ24742.1 hypothetical protein CBU03nite_11650 [Clostridium butyricum]
MKKEYNGQWYYAESEDEKFNGRLIIEDNRIILKVYGRMCRHNEFELYRTINGITNDGKKVTLIKCMCISYPFLGGSEMIYTAEKLILGNCYKDSDAINIKTITCNYTDLDKWFFQNSLKVESNEDGFDIRYNEPEIEEFDIGDFKIIFKSKKSCKGNLYNKITFENNLSIEFSFKEPVNIVDAIDTINHFRNLLTIFSNNKISFYNIRLVDYENINISLILNKMHVEKFTDKEPYDIFIRYSDIKENFKDIVERWYKNKEKIQPIVDYLSYLIEEDKFVVPLTFMTTIQAIEAFHRRTRNNVKINEDEHEIKVSRILNSLSNEDDIEWLSEILKYTNEPALPKRLKEMFKEVKFLVAIPSKIRDKLCWKICNTRNYYTHFSEDKKKDIMSIDEMFSLTNYLKLILRVLIFKDLEISDEDISNRLEEVDDEKYVIKFFEKEFKI